MTFSIVAKDPASGAFGVATATGGPCVGSLVPHARSGIGAVATQGYTTNPFFAFDGLDRMAQGESAQQALDAVTASDAEADLRQCIMIDAAGHTAGWTGKAVTAETGMILHDGVAVAGNLLVTPSVLDAALAAFEASQGSPLDDRLLAALGAGQAIGGDRRGTRSAALKVYTTELYPFVDLRVDWSDTPIDDLRAVQRASRSSEYATFFSRVPTTASR